MTLEELRRASSAQPFCPFVIHLIDGREIPVVHPELVVAMPNGETILVHQADATIDIIDLPQVARLELKPSADGRAGGENADGSRRGGALWRPEPPDGRAKSLAEIRSGAAAPAGRPACRFGNRRWPDRRGRGPWPGLPPLPPSVRIVRDEVSGRGPLQGLAAGLTALPDTVELAYASATDAPFLQPAWIGRLRELIGEADLAIPSARDTTIPWPHSTAAERSCPSSIPCSARIG